jgi:hypothetical protein
MRTLILMSAMAIALPGCAAPQRPASDVLLEPMKPLGGRFRAQKDPKDRFLAGECDHDVCYFLVTVKNNCRDVTIDPHIMIVKKKRKTTLTWDLDAPAGYTFDKSGAVPFKPSSVPPTGEFEAEKMAANGLSVTRRNNHTKGGTYEYQVRIAGPDGQLCGGIDPPIINEW